MSVLALSAGTAYAQSHLDAYKYAQTELSGTARYLSMGGAFGALGGDISAMTSNPAGLAVYRSSEVVTTLSLSSIGSQTNWLGNKVDDNKTKFNFDNIAYVGYFPTGNDEGLVSWNVGFAYNRVKNYSRDYTANGGTGLNTSLSDYAAIRAYGLPTGDLIGTDNYDPYSNGDIGDWLSVLTYQAGYTVPYSDSKDNGVYNSAFTDAQGNPLTMQGAELRVREWGSVDKYNLAFGLNFSDLLLLGANVSITDLGFHYASGYDEGMSENSNLYLDNNLETNGTGYTFNVGAIVRPVDFLRFGVAYNSPTWYKMTDTYQGRAGSDIPRLGDPLDAETPNGVYDYEYRAPDKWLFSAAAIFGTTALLSVDYELTNYKNMDMYYADGSSNVAVNQDISDLYKVGNTLRVGAEVRVTPQFAVRAGVAYSDSPMKDLLKNGQVDVATVGTIPHYTIDKGAMSYSVGLGYRFTPNFYTDIACVFRSYKEDLYNFSSLTGDNGDALITPQAATLKTNTTRVALTLGYKF